MEVGKNHTQHNQNISEKGIHAGHIPATSDTRILAITGIITGIYFVIELGIGLWTGSVAVISDAFHTFSAVGGILIALAASYFSKRQATSFQTFGLMRAEIVGALFNGLFLTGMAIFVFWMGFMRLMEPIELPPVPMLIAAGGGLITEAVAFYLLYKRQKENLNIKGAFWHILQTLVGSFIIIISAVVIYFTGFLQIDPLLGMAFGVVLFWASWKIIRDALSILLEKTPEDLDLNAVIQDITNLKRVSNIHHIHAWSLTSGRNIFSAHIKARSTKDIEGIQKAAQDLLKKKYHIYFTTLQVETGCLDEDAEEIDITQQK